MIDVAKTEMTKPYRKRKLCVLITLDIKNAFNSAPWSKIVEAMKKAGISKYLEDLIQNYLKDREIVGESFIKFMTAGAPQGSLKGPNFWNVLYDDVLKIPVPEGVSRVAYADDLAVIITAENEEILEQKALLVLGRIVKWMTETGLTIAPEKSKMVALIGKKKCRPLNIYIAGEKIIEKNNVKYLGVILDKSLKFGAHLEYVAAKAAKTITALSRIMPRVGGPGEQKRRVLQNAAESIILYAAPVWAECLHIKKRRIAILKAQRPGLLRVGCAYRTVSTDAIAVISGVIPLDLMLEERAQSFQATKEIQERLRDETLSKWQTRWRASDKGTWTRRLLKETIPWYSRKHGEVGYHLTQVLSGHGCFQFYKWRFKISDNASCLNCTAEHAIFHCERWAREKGSPRNHPQLSFHGE